MSIDARNRSRPPADEAPLSMAVVEAVSEQSGTPIVDLPPLYDVIDPDALDAFFSNSARPGELSFEYADSRVTIHLDQTIEVEPTA